MKTGGTTIPQKWDETICNAHQTKGSFWQCYYYLFLSCN